MTTPQPASAVGDVDLSQTEFWGLPLDQRDAAFARLRALPQPPLYPEPESPFGAPGPGFYALVRHVDVT